MASHRVGDVLTIGSCSMPSLFDSIMPIVVTCILQVAKVPVLEPVEIGKFGDARARSILKSGSPKEKKKKVRMLFPIDSMTNVWIQEIRENGQPFFFALGWVFRKSFVEEEGSQDAFSHWPMFEKKKSMKTVKRFFLCIERVQRSVSLQFKGKFSENTK